MVSSSSHLQSFPLIVEQLGDVPGNPLHQVLGVVPLDFKLTLLFVIDLQAEKTESHISFIKDITMERPLIPKVDIYCGRRSVQSAIIPMSSALQQNQL